jgi:PAS domain S-box-containing protein
MYRERNLIIEKSILGSDKGWELIFDAIPDLIAILDTDHKIVKVNRAMADKISKSPSTLMGTICYHAVHNSEKPPANCPHAQLLKDGLEHSSEIYEENLGGYFIVTASPISDDDGKIIGSIHIAHDITKRKEIEEKLEKTLQEKDILMKEIYHRVKNNLMVISSLLSLQSRYIKDKDTKEIFRESQNRAKSMALIHEKLYKSEDLKHINFTEYLQNLSNDLYNTYTTDKNLVKLVLDVDNIILDVEISIPLGLILNELLTNSLKHAFPDGRNGEIKVELHLKDDGRYYLSVEDNGIGIPKDLNLKKTGTLGMQIINSLTEQINGEIILDSNMGTKFSIFFKDQENN